MTGYIQVVTTTSAREEAESIAQAIVKRRLAACVQVLGPVQSFFHWQGKLDTAQEWLCLIKSRESHYTAIEHAIREIHSYEVPEILALPVTAGSPDYLKWLEEELLPE